MNPFWKAFLMGMLIGAFVSPLLIVMGVGLLLRIKGANETVRKAFRKVAGRYHLSSNPPPGLKRKRLPPLLKMAERNGAGNTVSAAPPAAEVSGEESGL